MNREQAEKLLGALIFDDLDDASKAQVLAYLETDEDLRESLADLRMALKVSADAVQQGPSPVLSRTRLRQLEKLSRSTRHQRVVLISRLTAVAAGIAIVAWVTVPRIGQKAPTAVTDYGHIRNQDMAGGTSRRYDAYSEGRNRLGRRAVGFSAANGESTNDGLAREGAVGQANARQMVTATNRPVVPGSERARQIDPLGPQKSNVNLGDITRLYDASKVSRGGELYVNSDASEPPTGQPGNEALSWAWARDSRGTVAHERLPSETAGSMKAGRVDLYAMHDTRMPSNTEGWVDAKAKDSDSSVTRSKPAGTQSGGAYSRALGQETQAALPREGDPVDVTYEGLTTLNSLPGVSRVAEPAGEISQLGEDGRAVVASNGRLPAKPEEEAEAQVSRYGFYKALDGAEDRLSSSVWGLAKKESELKLADSEPGVLSHETEASFQYGDFGSSMSRGTSDRQTGRSRGEERLRSSSLSVSGPESVVSTSVTRQTQTHYDFFESEVPDSAHGMGIQGPASGKVPILGDIPLLGGLHRDPMTDENASGGAMGGMTGAGMMGGGMRGGMGGGMGGGMMSGSMPGGTGGGGGMMGGMGRGLSRPGLQTSSGLVSAPDGSPERKQVLLQVQVTEVDGAAPQDLAFQKDGSSGEAGAQVWFDQAGRASSDAAANGLQEHDKTTVVATPYTLTQNGKSTAMSAAPEEYFMRIQDGESIAKGTELESKLRVDQGQKTDLDADLDGLSLSDGDFEILPYREKYLENAKQTHEVAEVTANLIAPAQPVTAPATESGEFSLPPASRFKLMPVNPWVLSEQDALSTFALDVDTASYALCRQYIQHGFLPPAGAVRMEEFVNAFDYAYAQRSEPTFSVIAEGASSPFAEPGQALSLVKIAVKARTVGRDQRKAAHLVFVVDASASMGQADRLPLIQQGLSRLVERLDPQDRVSLVSCSDQARLLLDRVPAAERDVVVQAVNAIQPSGSTNLLAGLQLGYATSRTGYRAGQVNQVILCSDGVANVGATEAESVLEAVAEDRKQGIMLMCVGVGYGAYNDVLLEALANQGDGRYVFVDGPDQVDRVLVMPLASALQTVAKDARIQVKFNPDVVRRYRLIGYENREIKDEQFRDDTVDAGEVGSGQCATALYEIELARHSAERGDLGTVFVRYQDTDTHQFEEIARPLSQTLIETRTVAQSPRFYLAASAARFAEWLRQSKHARATTLEQMRVIVDEISAALPLDQDIRELADLMRQAEGLPRAP